MTMAYIGLPRHAITEPAASAATTEERTAVDHTQGGGDQEAVTAATPRGG